jgi:DNA-binding protein HU-beta
MTRKDLTEKLSKEFGLTKKRSDEIVRFIFDQIAEELLLGGKVIIQSFGTFYWELVKERLVFNPRTKEKVLVPQRYKLRFEPAKRLKVRKK